MIITRNVNGRADWYQALAMIDSKTYCAWETTRHAAFMAVARQLAVTGAITF